MVLNFDSSLRALLKSSRAVGANAATENKRDNEIYVIRTSRFSLESALQRLLCSRTFKNNAIC